MQTQQTIAFFGTVSNSASIRVTKSGRKYAAFGVSIICDGNQAFSYNVLACSKKATSPKPLQVGTRIKLVVEVQTQPASIPLLTATFVRPDDITDAAEAAAMLHSHPVTIRLKTAAGEIPGRQIGNARRFSRKRITEWMRSA